MGRVGRCDIGQVVGHCDMEHVCSCRAKLILIQYTNFGRDWKSSVQEKYIHYTHTDYCVYNKDESQVDG